MKFFDINKKCNRLGGANWVNFENSGSIYFCGGFPFKSGAIKNKKYEYVRASWANCLKFRVYMFFDSWIWF